MRNTKNYATTVNEIATELNITLKEAKKLVALENERIWNNVTPRSINNPSKRYHGTNSPKKYSYNIKEISKHI